VNIIIHDKLPTNTILNLEQNSGIIVYITHETYSQINLLYEGKSMEPLKYFRKNKIYNITRTYIINIDYLFFCVLSQPVCGPRQYHLYLNCVVYCSIITVNILYIIIKYKHLIVWYIRRGGQSIIYILTVYRLPVQVSEV